MQIQDVCLSVHLSLRLSQASIVLKWLNISSDFFHHVVDPAQHSSFPC